MSKVQELINKMCPDGVPFKSIEELIIKAPKSPSGVGTIATMEEGPFIAFTSGTRTFMVNEYLVDGEYIFMNDGGQADTKYFNGKAYYSDHVFAFTSKSLNVRYLYHYLMKLNDLINKDYFRGGGIKNLIKKDFLKINVPVPPLEIQNELVRILDSFTDLNANLLFEQNGRIRQYEHYRNVLFEKTNGSGVTLGDVCDFVRGPFGGALKKEIFVEKGYAVYEQQNAINGNTEIRYYITEKKFAEMKRFEVKPNDLIMSCSGTVGRIFVIPDDAPKGIINQALLKLTPHKNVNSVYLKYVFDNYLTSIMSGSSRGGGLKNVPSVDILKTVKFILPPLEDQLKLIEKLNVFDNYVYDNSVGLSAEIEMRQKQYEFYRDRLFSFKEINYAK